MAANGEFPSPTRAELVGPSSTPLLHRYAAADSRWYVCQVCGNTFENRWALMGHMNAHRKPPPVVRCIRLFGVDISVVDADPDGVAE